MKKLCAAWLAVVMTLALSAPVLAADGTVPAKEAPLYFRVDGKLCPHMSAEDIDDSGLAYHIFFSYLIEGEYYVKIQEVAVVMGFSTSPFDVRENAGGSIEITTGTEYHGEKTIPSIFGQWIDGNTVTAAASAKPVLVNGAPRDATVYVIDGHNFMSLRDIAGLAGFSVSWDQQSGAMGLWSGAGGLGEAATGVYRATVNGAPEDGHLKWTNARVNTTPSYLNVPPTANCYDSGNGTVTVVDASYDTSYRDDYLNYGPVEVSVYDASDFSRISTRTLPEELPMFGAFLHGENYNYILYGQENPDQDDGVEVLRVVKYDQDWNRLGAVGVYGDRDENRMTCPFHLGGAAMAESGGELIVHTVRIKYTSYDGVRHQDSTTLGFDMDSLTQCGGTYGWGTSHSLGTDVVAGKDSYVTIDVSDSGKRALTFYRAGTEPYSYPDDSQAAYLFPQPGTGIPGLAYGDAATTATHYIAVAGERDPDFWIDDVSDSMFNVVVAAVPMDNVSTTASKEYVVGQYWRTDKTALLPTVAGLPDGRAIVLWQEYEAYERGKSTYTDKVLDVKYVVLNKDGSPSDVTGTLPGYSTSTCQPIVVGDRLLWYANLNNTRYFYVLPLADLGKPVGAGTVSPSPAPSTPAPSIPAPSDPTPPSPGATVPTPEESPAGGQSGASEWVNPFSDMREGDWFYEAVKLMNERSLMGGTSAATFSPNGITTRSMIVTILYRLEGSPAVSGGSSLSDVAAGAFYTDAVAWASGNGIVTGYSDGRFGPSDPITREQMAAIL